MYPSPATDVLTLTAEAPLGVLTVLDLTGRTCSSQMTNAMTTELPVADLPAGAYIVQVRFADGRWAVRRFVKQ